MKTTALVVGVVAALLTASAAEAAGWVVDASAFAGVESLGGIRLATDNDAECNGTATYCNGFVGRHSATKLTASTVVDSSASQPMVGSGVAHGFASSDLRSGELHLQTSTSGVLGTGAVAEADLSDTLHFSTTVPVAITVRLHIDGSYDTSSPVEYQFLLSGGGNQNLYTVGRWSDGNSNIINLSSPTVTYVPLETYGSWITYGPADFVGSFDIDAGTSGALLAISLQAQSYNGSFANFADTAAVSLDLPAGVTFTSDSGAFLTAPSGAPEPAAWVLLVAGFGAVGVAARRRVVTVAAA